MVNSEPAILEAAIRGLSEFGINAVKEDFIPFIGAGEDKFVGGVAENHGVPYIYAMKDRVYEVYLDIVDEKLGLYDGIYPLLDYLKSHAIPCVVASSADRVKVEANLRVAGFDLSQFGAVISGSEVVNKKPDPEIFLTAAAKINADPSDCIVIEDAVNGIMAAHAAGMRCIAVTTSFSREILAKSAPEFIIDDVSLAINCLKSFI